MVKNNKTKQILFLGLFVLLVWFLASYISIFSVYQQPFMVQYAGALHTQYASWWDGNRFNSDMTVEIGDYKFETVKYDKYYVDYGCKGNTCKGTFDHNDEYGCPIYKKTLSYFSCPNRDNNYYGCSSSGCNYPKYLYCSGACLYCAGSWSYHHPTVYCGGKLAGCSNEQGYINWGCSYLMNIYKNGELIKTIGYDGGCGSNLTGNSEFNSDDIEADFGTQKWYYNNECKSILNSYKIKVPDNAFDISIYSPEEYYIQGKNATVNIKIINNWKPVTTRVSANICQPTFGLPHCETYTKTADLIVGENELSYSIPTKYAVEKLEITPSVDLYFDLNTFNLKGLNIDANRLLNNDLQSYGGVVGGGLIKIEKAKTDGFTLYSLGSISGDKTEVEIKPTINPPVQPGLWDKISLYFASILLWISGIFGW